MQENREISLFSAHVASVSMPPNTTPGPGARAPVQRGVAGMGSLRGFDAVPSLEPLALSRDLTRHLPEEVADNQDAELAIKARSSVLVAIACASGGAYTHTHTAHEPPHANAVHRENVRQIQKMLEPRDTAAKRSRERQPVYTIRPAKEEFKRESMRTVMEARERHMTETSDTKRFYQRKAELLDLHAEQKVNNSHMHRCRQDRIFFDACIVA